MLILLAKKKYFVKVSCSSLSILELRFTLTERDVNLEFQNPIKSVFIQFAKSIYIYSVD